MIDAWTREPVLATDVGGTHVRFALVDVSADDPLIVESARRYRAADFESFGAAVKRYLEECGREPKALVIAAAGRSRRRRSAAHEQRAVGDLARGDRERVRLRRRRAAQ